jgi:predicted nucleic acid-binding protein
LSAYADTSFLVSVYVADAHTPKALPLICSAPIPLLATALTEFELENAIWQYQFRRELTDSDVKACIGAFRKDLANFLFDVKPFGAEMLRKASLISARQTPRLGTRALDVLHVASAIVLGAQDFYTFDRNQAKLADAEGLVVRDH